MAIGTNPSTPTLKPQIGAMANRGLFCFYSKRKRPQRVGVRDGYRDESLNSHFKAKPAEGQIGTNLTSSEGFFLFSVI
jgi:hypothetical protein